jgi:hypothetical protein
VNARPRMVTSGPPLGRETLLRSDQLAMVEDIRYLREGAIAASVKGACSFFRTDGHQCVSFDKTLGSRFGFGSSYLNSISISVESGSPVFIGRRASDGAIVCSDAEGNVRWEKTTDHPGNRPIVLEGAPPLIAQRVTQTEAILLNATSGKEVGKFGGTLGDIEAGVLAGDPAEVFVAEGEHGIDIRRADGSIVWTIPVDGRSFAVTRTSSGPSHVVVYRNDKRLFLADSNRNPVELKLPRLDFLESLQMVGAAEIGLTPHRIVSLLRGPGGWNRALLLIHGPTGALEYAEILAGGAGVVVPDKRPGSRAFLVGEFQKVVRFE